jgi:predicted nucleic acid-binding protein
MNSLVLDASIVAKWFIEEKHTDKGSELCSLK